MFTRSLGRSGIPVSAVGFGCWPIGGMILEFGKPVSYGAVDDAESIRAIHRAIDLGVTFFDTAEVYGRSEDILGEAFVGKRDQVVIATKFGRSYDRTRHDIGPIDVSLASLRQSLEGSLRRLRTDTIDLYQLHAWDCAAEDALAVREELEVLVQAGKIRSYAWSTDQLENVRLFAEGPHCTAVQQHFNVFEGNAEILAFCEAHHLASINRGPLAMGLLTGKYTPQSQLAAEDVRGGAHGWVAMFPDGKPNTSYLKKLAAIRDILSSGGRTLAQGALAWLWARSPVTIPIPGFKGIQQAEENARAMDFGPLTADQMTEIERLLHSEEGVLS